MKKFLIFLIVVGCLAWFCLKGLAYLPQPRKQIVIYGSASCARCSSLKVELGKSGIRYIFNDINYSQYYKDAMWTEIWKRYPKMKTVNPPVVMVGEKLMVTPEPSKVVAAYERPVFSWDAINKQWIKGETQSDSYYINVSE